MGLLVLILIVLLVWGNLSKKSPEHPLNSVSVVVTKPTSNEPTVGDSFNAQQDSIIAGINELNRTEKTILSSLPQLPAHAVFPIAPQPQPVKVTAPQPPLRTVAINTAPTRTQLIRAATITRNLAAVSSNRQRSLPPFENVYYGEYTLAGPF